MSAIEIITTKLLATPGVVSITSSAGIFPYIMPQTAKAPPVIVVNVVSENDAALHLSGWGLYNRDRVHIDCLATTSAAATALADAVRAALQHTIKATIGVYRDVDIFLEGGFSDFADDRLTFRKLVDVSVMWRV